MLDGMESDPRTKPDPRVCLRRFCFHWQAGELILPRTVDPASVAEGCRCAFGVCIRLDPERGDHDWYEPHEPNLEEAGLSWFYFIPSPSLLRTELREQYIEESERTWGREHWRLPNEMSSGVVRAEGLVRTPVATKEEQSSAGGNMERQPRTWSEVKVLLASKAAADPEFRSQLLADPKAVLTKGGELAWPEGLRLEVLEESASKRYLVLPPPARMELSDTELDGIAGGPTAVEYAVMLALLIFGGESSPETEGTY